MSGALNMAARNSNNGLLVLLCAASLTAAGETGPAIQRLLDAAVEKDLERVTLPAGRVAVTKLRLENAGDLVIEGPDTTIVFTDRRGTGWSINGCRNIVLRGFTVDYDPLPFVQGRVTGRSKDGKQYDFTVCDGYPGLSAADKPHYRQGYIFEAGRRRWKPWVPDLYAREVRILDGRRGRFIMGYAPAMHHLITVGDRIVLTLRTGCAVRMNDCADVRIEDVTFLAAPGCAYLGRYLRGDNYFRYTIRPGPPPPGATRPRLVSTCADGLNIAFATRGPTVERCRFSFMGDDSVNLHGATFAVLGGSPQALLVGWPYSSERLAAVVPAGAVARRLGTGNYAVRGTATISGFNPLPRASAAHLAAIHRVWPRLREGRGTVFRLELREPLKAEPGEYVDIPANNAPGFVIRDCVFADHRARGLRIMASRGLIEGNTFRRLKHSAITLGAEYAFWREAGWVKGITVRGNRIEDVGRDGALHSSRTYVPGAISVFVRCDREIEKPLWPGNRDITIEDNTIQNCPGAGIFAFAARNLTVRNNRIENVFYRPGQRAGRARGLEVRGAIDTGRAEDVKQEGNIMSGVGEAPAGR